MFFLHDRLMAFGWLEPVERAMGLMDRVPASMANRQGAVSAAQERACLHCRRVWRLRRHRTNAMWPLDEDAGDRACAGCVNACESLDVPRPEVTVRTPKDVPRTAETEPSRSPCHAIDQHRSFRARVHAGVDDRGGSAGALGGTRRRRRTTAGPGRSATSSETARISRPPFAWADSNDGKTRRSIVNLQVQLA